MQNIRAFFVKKGDARFLSHLDLMRCFSRALKRSKLDVWYTQGFNSHIYLMFSSPLSLGFESEYETMDFRIVSDNSVDFDDIKEKINHSLPSGVSVFNCAYPVSNHNDITFSEWSILLGGNSSELYDSFSNFLDQETILVSRTNKKGQIKNENALDYIKTVNFKIEGDNLLIEAVLRSDNSSSLNPNLLIKTFLDYAGTKEEDVRICRKKLLLNNMNTFE